MGDLAKKYTEYLRSMGMDSEGMFSRDLCCQSCGKPLNADGGHPAELYAGTFTGLCYPCTARGLFVKRVYPDGAKLISYPPHCPSWRRDREEYVAFDGCPECSGKGRNMERGQYGSYPKVCWRCWNLHVYYGEGYGYFIEKVQL